MAEAAVPERDRCDCLPFAQAGVVFWRTAGGAEVDLVAYGGDGLFAIEVKRSRTVRRADLRRLEQFKSDYPMARCLLLFGGDRREYRDGIELLPVADALGDPTSMLAAPHNSRRG